jgi:hypothetical protein
MGSGAYVVDLDPANFASSAPGVLIQQTVPLPPAQNSGGVKFGSVFLSLCANPHVSMTVEIRTLAGPPVTLGPFDVGPGRTGIGRQIQAGDVAAVITFTVPALPAGGRLSAAALVEYSTP